METWSANLSLTLALIFIPVALIGVVLVLFPMNICAVMLLILWLAAGVFVYESFIHRD
ncbi:MAG TPA: hypothetical protein VI893_08860 [Thermoplasmata archaeon]|nr:hypothetical protein [Thermoplasmata archaeon]